MRNRFKQTVCSCGCGKSYPEWINAPQPAKWKILSQTSQVNSIIRLSDGAIFTVGDTVLLKNPMNSRKEKAKLFKIQVEESDFMQMFAYALYKNGMFVIRNESIWMKNAEDITHFVMLQNITRRQPRGIG